MGTHAAPLPGKGGTVPNFRPMSIVPNGWMDQDGTWHGGRPRPRPHCVNLAGHTPPPKGAQQPLFSAHMSIVAKRLPISATAEHLLAFAICCHPSVCRLSVCNARSPYLAGWNFREYFFAIWYLGHSLTLTENCTEIVPGERLHMSFRFVPKSVTLNDPERRNGRYFANLLAFGAHCVKVVEDIRYLNFLPQECSPKYLVFRCISLTMIWCSKPLHRRGGD